MPFLLLKSLPRYETLLEASKLMPQLDPSAMAVYLHLLYAGDEASRIAESNLAKHGISPGRFMVMMLLMDKRTGCPRTCAPAELADHCRVTRATMTGLVDTLERDGLVKREADPTDRRMLLVSLTPKGHVLLDKIMPEHFRRMAQLMEPLSETERQTLLQLLAKIMQQAGTMAGENHLAEPLTA